MVNQTGAVFAQAEKMEFKHEFSPPQLCELPKPKKYQPPIPPLGAAPSSTTEPGGKDPFTTEKLENFEGNIALDATLDSQSLHKEPPHITLGYIKGAMVALLNSFGSNRDQQEATH